MKLLRLVTLVLVAHVSLIGLLIFQPGCNTLRKSGKDETAVKETRPMGEDALTTDSTAPDTVTYDAQGRSTPTRPSWSMVTEESLESLAGAQPVKKTGEQDENWYHEPQGKRYTVQKGDSLWTIAKREGITVKTLADANALTVNSVLRVGQDLVIPGPDAMKHMSDPMADSSVKQHPAHSDPSSYTVQKGDTLSSIASRHGVSVSAIQQANGMTGTNIVAGKTLKIPAKGQAVHSSGSMTMASSTPSKPAVVRHQPKISAGDATYTVQAGDTLSVIAKQSNMSVKELMDMNGISDPKKLRVGQTLKIKGGASAPAATVEAPKTAAAPKAEKTYSIGSPATTPAPASSPVKAATPSNASTSSDPFGDDLFSDAEEIPVISISH